MFEIAVSLGQVAVTAVAAAALGGRLPGSRLMFLHPALGWSARAAVGFLVISHAIFLLALLGLTGRPHLLALCYVLATVAAASLASTISGALRRRRSGATPRTPAPRGRVGVWRWLALAAAIAYASWIVLCVTLPPVAVDELIHHLAVPRAMLDAGGSVFFPDNIYAYFPALGEMLFLFGLGVGGETAARLFHATFGVLLSMALYGFSRRHLPAPAAAGAVIVLSSVPSVMVILPWAYVDLMFTLYAFLALTSLLTFLEGRRVEWAVFAGVMAGGALATKYTGLQLIMLLALLTLLEHVRTRRKGLPAAALVFVGVASAIAAPYVVRNWHATGWPLFPFELGPFQLRPAINWDADRAAMFYTMLASYGSGANGVGPASFTDSLAASVLVFLRASFNDPRWYDGVVGPVFLLVPVLLWRRTNVAAVRTLALFSVMFLAYWALTVRQVRFLVPILPVLCFLLAAGLSARRSRFAVMVVGACVVFGVATGVRKVLHEGAAAFWRGEESREDYLKRRFAGYAMYQAANARLGPGDRLYLVNMRTFGYYLRPQWRADFVFEYYQLEKLLASSTGPGDVAAFFTLRGITHVLIDERTALSAFALGSGQRDVLQRFLSDRATLLERLDGKSLYRLDIH